MRFLTASLSIVLPAAIALAQSPSRVERFAVHEVAVEARGSNGNPYVELQAEAVLRGPAGERRLPLFWDGGATWRFRLSPDRVGGWKWAIGSSDAGLNGKSGSLECVASQRAGSIVPREGFPRHFARQDGSPFWFLGDTAWALFTNSAAEKHDRAAALAYLDARAQQGFNVVHSMLLSEAGWGNDGGQPFDDLAAEKINPGYWQEVDRRLAHANSRGIVVGLALAWGDKGRGERYAWRKFPSAAARERYARYVAARYSAFDVYFLLSGEWHAEIRARNSDEESVRKEFIALGDALAAADPHERMIGIHPMTAHGSVREYAAAKWMAFGDYQQNYRDLHARVLESRAAVRAPVVNSEYGYFLRDQSGDGVPDKDNSTSLSAMRHATWDIVMAGGYVVTGFGTTYFGGNRDPGPFDLTAAKNKPWEEQIGHVKAAFADLDYHKLQPHDELLTCSAKRGPEGREHGRIVPPAAAWWCLAEPGRQYVVYVRGLNGPVQISVDTSAGPLRAARFNPRSGERLALDAATKDRFDFQPPDKDDWVVLLMR